MAIFNPSKKSNHATPEEPAAKKVFFSKSNGKFRAIYIPNDALRKRLASHRPRLLKLSRELDVTGSNYAFVKGRNCVLNAYQHVGKRYILNLDLMDFFDSVSDRHLINLLPRKIIQDCLIDGAPRQGLPTSPLVCTIALYQLDSDIVRALSLIPCDVRYTRYADDITFSFNEPFLEHRLASIIRDLVEKHHFRLNDKKYRFLSTRNGRAIICGVGIDMDGVYPTRKTKKRLRAALHQSNYSSARGLLEWSKCKLPNCLEVTNG